MVCLAARRLILIVTCTGPQDFAKLQLDEINKNIEARRNKIFLLMEEVRRLRIQQRLKARRDLHHWHAACRCACVICMELFEVHCGFDADLHGS